METIDFSKWVGRQSESEDVFSPVVLKRIAATFGVVAPTEGQPLPMLWHWCFFQDPANTDELGVDGHPVPGDFLPPAEGRQRMWAGSRIEFQAPFIAGAIATRRSTVKSVDEKYGRNGSLLFVTVVHEYIQGSESILREEQDIVYRMPSPPKLSSEISEEGQHWLETITPTPTLLFRYSAVTFNTHRIHYDWPYATEQEGYPGLVVHGPLTATFVLNAFIAANPNVQVKRFSFRGIRPLISEEPFEVSGLISEPGIARVWASTGAGLCQEGRVDFE